MRGSRARSSFLRYRSACARCICTCTRPFSSRSIPGPSSGIRNHKIMGNNELGLTAQETRRGSRRERKEGTEETLLRRRCVLLCRCRSRCLVSFDLRGVPSGGMHEFAVSLRALKTILARAGLLLVATRRLFATGGSRGRRGGACNSRSGRLRFRVRRRTRRRRRSPTRLGSRDVSSWVRESAVRSNALRAESTQPLLRRLASGGRGRSRGR